jgi:hypothetical protein
MRKKRPKKKNNTTVLVRERQDAVASPASRPRPGLLFLGLWAGRQACGCEQVEGWKARERRARPGRTAEKKLRMGADAGGRAATFSHPPHHHPLSLSHPTLPPLHSPSSTTDQVHGRLPPALRRLLRRAHRLDGGRLRVQ